MSSAICAPHLPSGWLAPPIMLRSVSHMWGLSYDGLLLPFDDNGVLVSIASGVDALVIVGGYASYTAQPLSRISDIGRARRPKIDRLCRETVISAAQSQAATVGAELVRVCATSAGEMRRALRTRVAPVEVGVVYARSSGRELRQGTTECRVRPNGRYR